MEKLAGLIHQAKVQLNEFDSRVEVTIKNINQMVSGDAAMKKALIPIELCITNYDYEQSLTKLTAWAQHDLGIS